MKNLNTFNDVLRVVANTTRYFTVSGRVISMDLSSIRESYIWKLFSVAELLNLIVELTPKQLCMYNTIVELEIDLSFASQTKIDCINSEFLELLDKRKKGRCNTL